jgi:hypothetical protein
MLQSLKQTRKGYEYVSGTDGNCVVIDVYYDKGGTNYFVGSRDPRGIYVSIRPVEIKDGIQTFVLFKGVKAFIKETKAASPKVLFAVAEKVDAVVALATSLYMTVGQQEAIKTLKLAGQTE